MGKISLIAIAWIVGVAACVRWASNSWIQALTVLVLSAVFLIVVHWILAYATAHPQSATLEGAEVILWQRQQIMLAAKNLEIPPQRPVIPNPEGSPPQLPGKAEDEV